MQINCTTLEESILSMSRSASSAEEEKHEERKDSSGHIPSIDIRESHSRGASFEQKDIKTQLSSTGLVIPRRRRSSSDVIRKATNSQLLK